MVPQVGGRGGLGLRLREASGAEPGYAPTVKLLVSQRCLNVLGRTRCRGAPEARAGESGKRAFRHVLRASRTF